MTPEDKILLVLSLLNSSRKLSAANSSCYFDPLTIGSKDISKTDLISILDKFENEKIIEILKTPNEVWPDLGKENEPEVYTLNILENFDTYYDKLYVASRSGIKTLSNQNYYRVYGVAEEIHQELNITRNNTVDIDATSGTLTLWKGINQKSISLYDIKQIKIKSLKFLEDIGAIDTFQLIDDNRPKQIFRVTVTRLKFDKTFMDFIFNSPANKRSSLVNRLVIDKQEKPKMMMLDDTAPKSDDRPHAQPVASGVKDKRINLNPLQPNHYSDRTGKLTVSPSVEVSIVKRGKVKRSNGTKYDQCHLMTCLFKSVNTLNNGVTFSTFLGVKYDKNSKIHIRKIRNTVDEINKKVAERTTAKKLIFIQGEKIILNHSYL